VDLHLKHRNGIVIGTAERNFHGNKKAISARSLPSISSLSPDYRRTGNSIRASNRASILDRIAIESRLRFHSWHDATLFLDDSPFRPALSGERRLLSIRATRNNCLQNTSRVLTDDENKIATRVRACRTAAIHESGNLVRSLREMDGWSLFRFACRTRREMSVKCESRASLDISLRTRALHFDT